MEMARLIMKNLSPWWRASRSRLPMLSSPSSSYSSPTSISTILNNNKQLIIQMSKCQNIKRTLFTHEYVVCQRVNDWGERYDLQNSVQWWLPNRWWWTTPCIPAKNHQPICMDDWHSTITWQCNNPAKTNNLHAWKTTISPINFMVENHQHTCMVDFFLLWARNTNLAETIDLTCCYAWTWLYYNPGANNVFTLHTGITTACWKVVYVRIAFTTVYNSSI